MRDDRVTEFDHYHRPDAAALADAADGDGPGYVVCSANPRLVDGKPRRRTRATSRRGPTCINARATARRRASACGSCGGSRPTAARHRRSTPSLAGRRNNPPTQAGIPALCVYGPIHYQELPELFMEFICSLTGKSPSTTGAGSEGALTKGPFNALPAIVDLNAALLSYILTGPAGFSRPPATSARRSRSTTTSRCCARALVPDDTAASATPAA